MRERNRRVKAAEYGIDAPGVIKDLFLAGATLLVLARFVPVSYRSSSAITGGILIAEAAAMLLYARVGKFKHRDRMLGMLEWTGREKVLDVGTGRGLLAIGAAKRLDKGRAVGIDIWSAEDLSGNGLSRALENVSREGMLGRVELRTEDARCLTFPDNSFDVVLSNLALHNIASRDGRKEACEEIARVLKPGGTALISDFRRTREYMRTLRAAGLAVSRTAPFLKDTFPPLRVVRATKPLTLPLSLRERAQGEE